jgi:hypothetical protein
VQLPVAVFWEGESPVVVVPRPKGDDMAESGRMDVLGGLYRAGFCNGDDEDKAEDCSLELDLVLSLKDTGGGGGGGGGCCDCCFESCGDSS